MRDVLLLAIHFVVTIVKLVRLAGVRAVAAIVGLKSRNPKFGCMRIAQQIAHTFGVEIDKDVMRRVLAKHYRPDNSGSDGPSWLTLIVQSKDSLWSVDMFRCESILLRSH